MPRARRLGVMPHWNPIIRLLNCVDRKHRLRHRKLNGELVFVGVWVIPVAAKGVSISRHSPAETSAGPSGVSYTQGVSYLSVCWISGRFWLPSRTMARCFLSQCFLYTGRGRYSSGLTFELSECRLLSMSGVGS